jgi:hypothetical protein
MVEIALNSIRCSRKPRICEQDRNSVWYSLCRCVKGFLLPLGEGQDEGKKELPYYITLTLALSLAGRGGEEKRSSQTAKIHAEHY